MTTLSKSEQIEYEKRLQKGDWRINIMLDPITWQILKIEQRSRHKTASELVRYSILKTFKNLETQLKLVRIEKAKIAQKLSRIQQREAQLVEQFKHRLGDKWEYIEFEINDQVRHEVEKLI